MKFSSRFKLNALMVALLYLVSSTQTKVIASADSPSANGHFTFDPIFLSPGLSQSTDLSRFEKGAAAIPGTYEVDVFVNNRPLGRNTVTFEPEKTGENMMVCMTTAALQKIGLNLKEFPDFKRDFLNNNQKPCVSFEELSSDINISYDSGSQQLYLTVPQAYLRNDGYGYVDPELWDRGINVFMLGYQSNYYTMTSNGKTSDSAFVGLNSGLNFGAWQLRHNGNYAWQNDVGGKYQRINTYLQRDISSIKSRVILGENNSSGQVFDTIPFRGMRLSDDDRMLPQSERGYAPEIRGIARTNAKVTVRQNGQILRETTVVPGAFNINNLYPTGYGGDLDVTVSESDGSVQTFSVPYSAVDQLLRPGAYHYDIIAGKYNYNGYIKDRSIYQATLQYGINNAVTGYGGMQYSDDDYSSVLGGLAFNTPAGALALDLSHSETKFSGKNENMSGQSYRASFSKRIFDTKSSVSIAAYRYSTSGYLDLGSAMGMMNEIDSGRNPDRIYRPKNRFSATLNQGLPDGFGYVYLTGYTQNYWNTNTTSDLQYQLGYNNNLGRATFGLNAGRTRNTYGQMESSVMLNLTVPLGETNTVTASLIRDSNGNYGEQVSFFGVAGKENELNYGISGSHYSSGNNSSGSMNGSYRSQFSNLNGSLGTGKGFTNASVGASGTLLGYSGGVVLTPYTSDTFAIIEAEGAQGASVGHYTGVKVDRFGHAAVPYLNAYQMNEISLDPKGVSRNIEFLSTSQAVAPHHGAVVKLQYQTDTAIPLLITLSGIENIPFGAIVTDTKGNQVGVMGQGGRIYTRVSSLEDILRVSWDEKGRGCNIRYSLTKKEISTGDLLIRNAVCSS